MKREEEVLGKLISLQEVREEAERQALARAACTEARVAVAEREAEERHRALEQEIGRAARVPAEPRSLAEVLQLQDRFVISLRRLSGETERRRAALRAERASAVEAVARVQGAWERARRARERSEERRRLRSGQRRRARERAEEETALDDAPPRGGGEGG